MSDAARVEILDGRWLRAGSEDVALTELAAGQVPDVRVQAGVKLPRAVVVRTGDDVWRLRFARAEDGRLEVAHEAAGPFHELRAVELDGTRLRLDPAVPADALRWVAREGDATTQGPDIAALTVGVWDAWADDRRLGRHLDGFTGLGRAAVAPGVAVPAGWAQLFWTVDDNLSVRVTERPPQDEHDTEPGERPAKESLKRRLLAKPAVALHRTAVGRHKRPAAAADRGPGGRVYFLLLHAYGMGGTIRTCLNLAGGLAAAGQPVTVLSLTRRRDEPFFPFPAGVEVKHLDDQRHGDRGSMRSLLIHPDDFAFPWCTTRTDDRLAAALADLRPGDTLIVTRPAFAIVAARLAPQGVRVIAQEHLHFDAHRPRLQADMLEALRDLDALVVLTEADERAYAAALKTAPVKVTQIPNAVPPLGPGVSDRSTPTLVAAGRLNRQKGFDLLLDAWAQIHQNHPDWTLAIHGAGPARDALRRQIGALGVHDSVLLPGQAHRFGDVLQYASAFVLSSRWEGFGMVLVEAMGKGLPVVSFDCPQGPGEIITDGVDGTLVPDGDVAGLAAGLDRLLADGALRDRQGAAGLQTAARYALQPITRRWLDLLAR